jgi:hypothetical protein
LILSKSLFPSQSLTTRQIDGGARHKTHGVCAVESRLSGIELIETYTPYQSSAMSQELASSNE